MTVGGKKNTGDAGCITSVIVSLIGQSQVSLGRIGTCRAATAFALAIFARHVVVATAGAISITLPAWASLRGASSR